MSDEEQVAAAENEGWPALDEPDDECYTKHREGRGIPADPTLCLFGVIGNAGG